MLSSYSAPNEKIQIKILLFLLFFCSLDLRRRPKHLHMGHFHTHRDIIHFFSLKISLCFVRWFYIQRTQKHAEQKRERALWEGERNSAFFLSSSLLCFCWSLDGERERVILNFRSFVRCFHCTSSSSSSRDERTTLLLTTTTKERKRERERDLRVWARVFCRFLPPRITHIIDRRRRRRRNI